MGKLFDVSLCNAKLAKLATGNRITYCTTQPANVAGLATLKLLQTTLTAATNSAADGVSGSYTFSTSGNNRQVVIAQQSSMVATASSGANGTAGTAQNCNYVAIDDGTTLLFVDTVPTFSITAGQTYNGNAITVADGLIPT